MEPGGSADALDRAALRRTFLETCSGRAAGVRLTSMWWYVDEPWQYRVLDLLPPGIDHAQLERARSMSATERLDAVVELMELGEALAEAVAAEQRTR
jgi:hypothetical protein